MKYKSLSFKKPFKLGLTTFLAVMFFASCQTTGESVNTSPSATAWKNGVKGAWVLNTIDKENFPKDYVVKTIFEEAPPECFVGSVWYLPSNGKGHITFESEGILCAPGAVRNIQWSIFNPGRDGGNPQFQFKKIYPGDHPKNVIAGYRLELSFADEHSLVMRMPVELGTSTGFLVFRFIR